MSFLRILGIFSGAICLYLSIAYSRTYTRKASPLWLGITGMGLVVVSFFPGILTPLPGLFSLGGAQQGRLLMLLIIGVSMSWFFIVYERGKSQIMENRLEQLVRNLALEKAGVASMEDSIVVVMPAYDEKDNVSHVLKNMPKEIQGHQVHVLLVDDGSKDDTAAVAQKHGAQVIRHLVNIGGGAALKSGYAALEGLHPLAFVTMDSDGQHDPKDLAELVDPIVSDTADLVVGSRMLGGSDNYSKLRYTGVNLFSWLINRLLNISISDCASGYRAFTPRIINTCTLTQRQYHTAEMIIECAKREYRITERPIYISNRLSGKSKKGKDFFYALNFLKTILVTWLR